ncbi:GGDEF domain-containing protein [Planctomicrobium sp. SH664]|uniref:GGDEF domain-containing protein n=1 Tax=Planctomicrobium sp. SH664 TaxID=3448125 RepID=UPI003F5C15ED
MSEFVAFSATVVGGLMLLTAGISFLRHWLTVERMHRGQSTNESTDPPAAARLIELTRENAAQRFEIAWLRSTSNREHSWESVVHLLTDATAYAGNFEAWLISPNGQTLQNHSKEGAARRTLTLSRSVGRRLKENSWLELSADQSDFQITPSHPTGDWRQLFAFQCGQGTPLDPVLVTSGIPCISGSDHDDCEQLARLVQGMSWPVAMQHHWTPQETALVRDMLELRTVTDIAFSSPRELLEEFLSRLATLTGFERASLYLDDRVDALPVSHFATGGRSVDSHTFARWQQLEELLIARHAPPSRLLNLNLTGMIPSEGELLLQTVVFAPANHLSNQSGLLILTSRDQVCAGQVHEELILWATQFLMQTLERELNRMQLEDRARRDALTQVANRHTFDQELRKLLRQCELSHEACSLLLIDVDHFKSVNDTYGHPAGDAALKAIAQIIQRTVQRGRVADRPLVARFGGEEFAVLLPEVSLAGAKRMADEVLRAVHEQPVSIGDYSLQMSVSVGVGSCPLHGVTAGDLLSQVDAALYAAKREGRNRVMLATRNLDTALASL